MSHADTPSIGALTLTIRGACTSIGEQAWLHRADRMKIHTLFERTMPVSAEHQVPAAITAVYDGRLAFSPWPNGRPLIIGNFVQTLDGIVSLKIPHQSGGGVISGGNEEDRPLGKKLGG